MAAETVKSAILSVIEKTPSEAPRSKKLREWSQEILAQSDRECFEKFSTEMVVYLQDVVSSTAKPYKLTSSKREHLWTKFHCIRMKGKLPSLWDELVKKMNINVTDSLLQQSVFQEVFELCLKEHFSTSTSAENESNDVSDIVLTADELNIIRYVSGYIARTLLKRYEKQPQKNPCNVQFITCLGEMAVAGEGDDVLSYTRKWIDQVNRGGLFPTNNASFQLFTDIEKCVQKLLPSYLHKSKSDIKTFQSNVHDLILQNEDVQFYWTLLSQDIESPEDSYVLLGEIIKLWVTVRGFAMAASWMELYKTKEKQNTQKATGLRKSVSGQSS